MDSIPDRALLDRTTAIFEQQRQQLFRRTDRMFAVLMVLQWLGGIAAAIILSPRTWNGAQSEVHPHVWLALVFGGVLTVLPVYLACWHPGRALTRHVIAVTQILFSSLFIHISGGRIETHFHVFGSLAFLAFYRDWRVLIPPTVVVALDHYIRGVYWPATVFGIATSSPWRWLEHAAWVVFEDVFLIISCRSGVAEMWADAKRTAELEQRNADYRQRTRELEQAYESKNAIVETALDAVISMDMGGYITGWNSQAERTFGWTAEEAIGRELATTVVSSALRESHVQGLQRFRETGASTILNRRIEVTAVHRDGHEFSVEVAIAPIRGGAGTGFSAFVRDITERQQSADALRRAKEAAEAANRAKTAFLAHMSHEIRTPLNGILGFADILRNLPAEAEDAQRRDYLQTIHDSGRHLLNLIDNILDLSKIESGRMEMEAVRCAPHELIAEVISILRVRAEEKGVHLEYRWRSSVPETIVTDPSRFRQLLMNLIGNAIKFTEKGSVSVIARIDGPDDRRSLAIDVIDTGIGISPEKLEHIFRPFSQADESITRRFGGTGLGLAISRQIAELLGGGLTVYSEHGRGSRFTASIDVGSLDGVRLLDAGVADVVSRSAPATALLQRTLPPASILLVEDGVTNRKLIGLVLERAGANVVAAENGQIALDLVDRRHFDLILMDMQMPVLDGYRAAAELRRRGVAIPIIALTAHAMKGDEERCQEAGCSGYLTKPIESGRLIDAVARALASSRTVPGAESVGTRAAGTLASTLPLDDPEFREIVDQFVDQLPERLARMQAALKDARFDELARLAHWLKGSGGTVGFDAFRHPAASLEQLSKANDAAAASAVLDELQALYERIDRRSYQSV